MVTRRLAALAAYTAEMLDRAALEGPASTQQRRLCAEAVDAVKAGGAELLASATPWLWRYYRDVADEVGDDLGMAALDATADIWEHVNLPRVPKLVLGGDHRAPSPCYVSFEGEVEWEPDHGLQLVFDHEGRLARVGPYSGHVTVARATDSAAPGAIYG